MGDIFALLGIAASVIVFELLWRRSLLRGAGTRRKPRLAPEPDEANDRTSG